MTQVFVSILSLGLVGLFFGIIISILDNKLKVEEDLRVKEVLSALPGINCGACGFAGCKAYAVAAVKDKSLFSGCKPGGDSVDEKVSSIIGADMVASKKQKVVVFCSADLSQKKNSTVYRGPKTCASANLISGSIDCQYGCLGLGDCIDVCPTDALILTEGRVVVDYNKCIGCGKCVEVCPRNIMKLADVDKDNIYIVACNNPEDALSTKKVCSTGCIGCGICTKIIKDSPFYMEDKLSKVNLSKLKDIDPKQLDMVKNKCPVKIIKKLKVK